MKWRAQAGTMKIQIEKKINNMKYITKKKNFHENIYFHRQVYIKNKIHYVQLSHWIEIYTNRQIQNTFSQQRTPYSINWVSDILTFINLVITEYKLPLSDCIWHRLVYYAIPCQNIFSSIQPMRKPKNSITIELFSLVWKEKDIKKSYNITMLSSGLKQKESFRYKVNV